MSQIATSTCFSNISGNGDSTTSRGTLQDWTSEWQFLALEKQCSFCSSSGVLWHTSAWCAGLLWLCCGTPEGQGDDMWDMHVWSGGLSWALQQKKIFSQWLLEDHSCGAANRPLRSTLSSPLTFSLNLFIATKHLRNWEELVCVQDVERPVACKNPLKLPFISRYNWPNSLSCFDVLVTDIAQGKAGQELQTST